MKSIEIKGEEKGRETKKKERKLKESKRQEKEARQDTVQVCGCGVQGLNEESTFSESYDCLGDDWGLVLWVEMLQPNKGAF